MLGRKGGITILEMAIVLVVAASVVVIASRWFMVTQARAKQSEAKQILRQIYVEEQAYHRNHGTYWAGKKRELGWMAIKILFGPTKKILTAFPASK